MPQNPVDDSAVFNEGDDFHLGPAIEAGQGVGFRIFAMSRRHWAEVGGRSGSSGAGYRFARTSRALFEYQP